jgi:ABC-type transporter Mla subunit MlaD
MREGARVRWSLTDVERMGRLMSEATPDPERGANPFSEMVRLAVAAQERSLNVAQSWSDTLLATLKEQSEDSRASLATLAASLKAMERALESQEETNRAIRQSLEGYRDILDRFAAAQERSARLVQTAVDTLRTATEGQLEAARAMLSPPPGVAAAAEPFNQMLEAWNTAFRQMMGAGPRQQGSS